MDSVVIAQLHVAVGGKGPRKHAQRLTQDDSRNFLRSDVTAG